MGTNAMYRQSLLVVFGLVFATSCVPQPMATASSRISRPIAAAQPLLRKLDLTVPIDDTGVQTAAGAAFARNDFAGAPPFVAAMRSEDDSRRATDCLTQAVYYEARSEPVDGQRAVAQVVLNRVRDRAFPHSVCGVVFQGSQRRTGCQFSFTCDGSMAHRLEPSAWDRARSVAQAALSGSVYAPIGSATYYHANYILPWWASSLTRIGAVGSHIFYRWRGALERALAFRQDYSGREPGTAGVSAAIAAVPADMGVTVHYANASHGDAAGDAGDALAAEGNVMVHRGRPSGPVTPLMASSSAVHVHLGDAGRVKPSVPGGAAVSEETDATS